MTNEFRRKLTKHFVIGCTFANILVIAYLVQWMPYRIWLTMTPTGDTPANRFWAKVTILGCIGSIVFEFVLFYFCYRVMRAPSRPKTGFPVVTPDEESNP